MLQHVPRLHLRATLSILVVFSAILWLSLPYNNKLVLVARWHFHATTGAMTPNDNWLFESPLYPLDMDDVAMLIKTGYSTQERVAALLNTTCNAGGPTNVVLLGDYSTSLGSHFNCNGVEVPVHNALAWMIDREHISLQLNVTRLKHYSELASAIAAGDKDMALSIGKAYGWGLDAMKASLIIGQCFCSFL